MHHGAPAWCQASVAAIRRQSGLALDVIVVDNSGELVDGSHALPADVTVIASPSNLGYAGGANLGLRHALAHHPDARAVVVCAHDFHPAGGALERLLETLGTDGTIGILAPQFGPPRRSVGGRWDGRRADNVEPGDDDAALIDSDWLCGTCLVLRVACLNEIGGFDSRFGSYVEDVDLCLRARDAGWRVATVRDAHGHGLGSSSTAKQRLMLVNGVLLVAKRCGAAQAWRLVAAHLWFAMRQVASCAVRTDRRRRLDRARVHLASVAELVTSRRIARFAGSPDAGVGSPAPARPTPEPEIAP